MNRWAHIASRTICVAALLLSLLAPPFLQVLAAQASGADCGMICCRRAGTCCCKNAAGDHSRAPSWQTRASCSEKCRRPSAAFSQFAGPFFLTEAHREFHQPLTAAAWNRALDRRGRADFNYCLFQRPPPPASLRQSG